MTDWNSEFSEALDEVYEDKDTPYVLLDGMSGEYMVFGVLLFDSGDFRWGDLEGVNETEVSKLPDMEYEYRETFKKKFPDFYHLIDVEWTIIGIVHYS